MIKLALRFTRLFDTVLLLFLSSLHFWMEPEAGKVAPNYWFCILASTQVDTTLASSSQEDSP